MTVSDQQGDAQHDDGAPDAPQHAPAGGSALPPPPPPPPPPAAYVPPAAGPPFAPPAAAAAALPPLADAPSADAPSADAPTTTAPAKRSKRGRILAGVAAVAVVAAGTAVTVKLVSSQSSGGAASPEEAVQDMVGSLEQNDLLGVVDVLAPWERDFARQGIDNYLDDAKDNGLLAKDTDLNDVGGYTLTVDGLKVSSEPVNERIANVSLVGGTAHLQSHVDQLPLGAKLLEQLDKANDGKGPDDVSGTTDLAEAQLPPITTIKQDGRWYVSLFYSIAEAARRDTGAPAPTTEGAIQAKGADSPQAAVDELIDALEQGDVERLIELTPPDEMAVLHDYAPLFLKDATPSSDGTVKITDRDYSVVDVTGGRKVIPQKLTAVVSGDDPGTLSYERTGDHVQITLDRDGETTTLRLEKADNGSTFVVQGPAVDLRGTITAAGESTIQIGLQGKSDDQSVTGDLTLTPEGTCVTVKGDLTTDDDHQYVDDQVCPEDLLSSQDGDFVDKQAVTIFGQPIDTALSLDKLGKLVQFEQLSKLFDLGIVTVKVDGKWYVSPLRTTADLFGTFGRLAEGLQS